jgi:hypothetical protein
MLDVLRVFKCTAMAGATRLVGMRHRATVVGEPRGIDSLPRRSQILQLREELMEGAAQPTQIVRPRPRRRGPMEGARDRVLDGACSYFYYLPRYCRRVSSLDCLIFLAERTGLETCVNGSHVANENSDFA